MSSGIIANPYNDLLAQRHDLARKAVRFALSTLCDPATGEPQPITRTQIRQQLRTIQINAATAGDNIIIPALAGVKLIYELVLWNSTAQTLIWQQGFTGSQPIQLFRLSGFPALTGFSLGFNGSFEQPHWEIDNGQALVLVLANPTQVDGFIRYRVQNGTA